MQDFQAKLGDIRGLGGEVYGVVAQGQPAADTAKRNWGLDFAMVSDPQVSIGEALADRRLLDIYVDEKFAPEWIRGHGPMPGGGYVTGMYQPAIVALTADFKPLFLWASAPTMHNIGGALGRPEAADVMKAVHAGLAGDASLVSWVPPKAMRGPGGGEPPPRPLFYFLLLANGNFLSPKGFGLDFEGGDLWKKDFKTAGLKAVAMTAAAVVSLARRRPNPQYTLAALAAYCAYVHVVWGHMFEAVWKSRGSDPKDSLLYRRRAGAKL